MFCAMKLELNIPRKHHVVLFSDKHHLCLFGGRGAAKSVSAANKIIVAMCKRRVRVACCRQYQANIRESSKELIEQIIRDNGLADQFKFTEQEIIHRLNGSQIIFIGLERNLDKVRAIVDIDIWWIDEAQNVSQEAIDVLIPTARKLGSQLIWTWNPTNPSDPVETTFRCDPPRADTAIACVLWSDNPWFFSTTMPGEMQWHARPILRKQGATSGTGCTISPLTRLCSRPIVSPLAGFSCPCTSGRSSAWISASPSIRSRS